MLRNQPTISTVESGDSGYLLQLVRCYRSGLSDCDAWWGRFMSVLLDHEDRESKWKITLVLITVRWVLPDLSRGRMRLMPGLKRPVQRMRLMP